MKVLSCSIDSICSNRNPVGDVKNNVDRVFILEQIERILSETLSQES